MHEYEPKYIVHAPDSVMSVLEMFSTSEEGIAKFSHLLNTEVEEGRVDPLKVAIFMKTMEKIKEKVNEVLAPYYLNEAGKYGDKPFNHLGATIGVSETGVKYDYSKCNHPGWNDLTKIIEEATNQRKMIESLLKVLKTPTVLVIEGEAIEVNPPVKTGKMSINIKIQ